MSDDKVVPFEGRRRKGRGRPKEGGQLKPDHVTAAQATLKRIRLMDGQDICFANDELWVYSEGLWRLYPGNPKQHLDRLIHGTVDQWNEELQRIADDDMREESEGFEISARFRQEVRRHLETMPDLAFEGEWDSHGLVPFANGLFDPDRRVLIPYRPEHRATFRFAAAYDPLGRFESGEQMIRDVFTPYGADADKYVWLIRQFAYVALFKAGQKIGRQLRRGLYLFGGANSGKSQLVDLLRRAIGPEFSSTLTLDQVGQQFGLEGLLRGKALWAADEAASDSSTIDAGRVKALLSEDVLQCDVKNRNPIEGRLLASAIFSSNSYPRTLDRGDGFSDRFMLLHCPAEFDSERPTGIALAAKAAGFATPAEFVAATELPGFVNWALGAQDLIEREKRFDQPPAVIAARTEIADRANPVRTFTRDCLERVSVDRAVKSTDVFETYREWVSSNFGNKHACLGQRLFWDALRTALGRGRGYVRRGVARHHAGAFVAGVVLSTEGIEYWTAASNRKGAGDSSISPAISTSDHAAHIYLTADQVENVEQALGKIDQAAPSSQSREHV